MRRSPRLALAAALALGLAACTPEKIDPPLNPNPTEAYVFEVWTEGAPRPMQSATIELTYTFTNSWCLPATLLDGLPAFRWERHLPAVVEKTPDGRFRATIHADHFQSVDLYGKGVCEVTVYPKVTLDDGEQRYVLNAFVVPGKDVAQQGLVEVFSTSRAADASQSPRWPEANSLLIESSRVEDPAVPSYLIERYPPPEYFMAIYRSHRPG